MSGPHLPAPGLDSSSAQRLASSRADIESWLARDSGADASAAGAALCPQAEWRGPRVARGPQEAPPRLWALLLGALAATWLRRPAQAPVQAGLVVLEASLSPLAHRHPWALTAAAVGLGMALGLARPWRWLFRPAVLAGLVIPLVSHLALRCLQPGSTRRDVAAEHALPPSTI